MSKPDRERLWERIETEALGFDAGAIQDSFAHHLEYTQCKTRFITTPLDCYKSLSLAIRDRLIERWNDTNQTYFADNVKRVYYLSLEYLMGRALDNAVTNLRIETRRARGDGGLRRRLRGPARPRPRRGPRERGPGAPRGVLPRLDGHPPAPR